MKFLPVLAISAIATTPALAEDQRQLDAHEHGVGQLNIAFDGDNIAMELHAPGADIVGFEYQAERDEDLAAIDTALAQLSAPLELFVLPAAAGCSVVNASAELESEDAHDDHDDDHKDEHAHDEHDDDHKDEHAHDEHDEDHKDEDAHDEHDDDHKDEHAHDEHDDHKDEDAHDDHDDDHKEEHGHDEHEDEHKEEAGHTEFHAEYLLTCSDISAATGMTFAYFDTFPNAVEVEVQAISATGSAAFEVERDAPTLDLSSMF